MLKDELDLIEVFRKNIFHEDSIRGLMKQSGRKSYGRVFETAQHLLKEKVLFSNRHGKSIVCGLNLENNKSINYLSFLEYFEAEKSIKPEQKEVIEEICNGISLKNYILLFLNKSDSLKDSSNKKEFELVFIVDDEIDSSRAYNILVNLLKLKYPSVTPFVFKVSEFSNMLLTKEDNFAKKLFMKKIVYAGAGAYYSIVKDSIKKGFRI